MTGPKERSGSAATSPRKRFSLTGRSTRLDPRVHAVRGDLADITLFETVFSAHYAQAVVTRCTAPHTMLHQKPDAGSVAVSQILHGESFHVLDLTGQWAWGYCGHDDYVGYVARELLEVDQPVPDHVVTAQVAPLFTAPDIKSPIAGTLPIGALFQGVAEGGFIPCGAHYVHARHAALIADRATDWVAVAMDYAGQPYRWGGRGGEGIDCSGLVQQSLARCGIDAQRDTDLQRASLGVDIPADAPLRRGDIVFFPGHVGMMVDGAQLLHANAHWMRTVVEPLADVIARLAPLHETPVLARRRIMP